MAWPFEPVTAYAPLPPEIMVGVLSDDVRLSPEGAKFGMLDVVRVYHGLDGVSEERRDLIWPLLKKHGRKKSASEA